MAERKVAGMASAGTWGDGDSPIKAPLQKQPFTLYEPGLWDAFCAGLRSEPVAWTVQNAVGALVPSEYYSLRQWTTTVLFFEGEV